MIAVEIGGVRAGIWGKINESFLVAAVRTAPGVRENVRLIPGLAHSWAQAGVSSLEAAGGRICHQLAEESRAESPGPGVRQSCVLFPALASTGCVTLGK